MVWHAHRKSSRSGSTETSHDSRGRSQGSEWGTATRKWGRATGKGDTREGGRRPPSNEGPHSHPTAQGKERGRRRERMRESGRGESESLLQGAKRPTASRCAPRSCCPLPPPSLPSIRRARSPHSLAARRALAHGHPQLSQRRRRNERHREEGERGRGGGREERRGREGAPEFSCCVSRTFLSLVLWESVSAYRISADRHRQRSPYCLLAQARVLIRNHPYSIRNFDEVGANFEPRGV